MGLKMKNINIMGVRQFLGEEGVFEGSWYLAAHYDLILVQVGT